MDLRKQKPKTKKEPLKWSEIKWNERRSNDEIIFAFKAKALWGLQRVYIWI